MPITRYDQPFPEYIREPSESAIALRGQLIEDGIIPVRGKVPLTLELFQKIIETVWFMRGPNLNAAGKSFKETSEAFDSTFHLYTDFAREMPGEIEVTVQFLDDMLLRHMAMVIGESYDFVNKLNLGKLTAAILGISQRLFNRLMSYQPSPGRKNLIKAIEYDCQNKPQEALKHFDKAVEYRADIEPLLKRGWFLERQKRSEQAIADYSLAIKEGEPEPLKRASAYAHRGICYVKQGLTEPALDDLVHAFEGFKSQLQSRPPKKDPDDVDEVQETSEYFLEQCVPEVKTIDQTKKPVLSSETKQKLDHLKALILSVRQIVNY